MNLFWTTTKTYNKNDGQVSYVYDCGPIYSLIFFEILGNIMDSPSLVT